MCGISGFIALSTAPASLISAMTDVIRHRGPDDEGYAVFETPGDFPLLRGGVDTPPESFRPVTPYAPVELIGDLGDKPVFAALGHRRLSIVDLSPLGHQPMSYADGRYWLTYNGEIYNYIELRAELEKLGHHFSSHTDTEVIMAAYAEWGADCLHRFNGMWAFALYDRRDHKFFLARDRFGIKPLYYWISPDAVLYFGSEIKQFTGLPAWKARINGQRAYDFLAWGIMDHMDETLFAGVYQVRPGHAVELTVPAAHMTAASRLLMTPWYKLASAPFEGSFDDAALKFRALLKDAVRLRLRADVPVGSCLSGGLDSSSIVCLMKDLLAEQKAGIQQKTFSACADVDRFNEKTWIDEVVGRTGVDAAYVYPALEKLFDSSRAITWHQDEPFASTHIYAQWNVFALAAGNVTVMLDGQGADEYLAGYHGFFAPLFAGLFRHGKFIALWRQIRAVKKRHGYSELRAVQDIANMLLPAILKAPLRRLACQNHTRPSWLNLDVLKASPCDPNIRLGNLPIISGRVPWRS